MLWHRGIKGIRVGVPGSRECFTDIFQKGRILSKSSVERLGLLAEQDATAVIEGTHVLIALDQQDLPQSCFPNGSRMEEMKEEEAVRGNWDGE